MDHNPHPIWNIYLAISIGSWLYHVSHMGYTNNVLEPRRASPYDSWDAHPRVVLPLYRCNSHNMYANIDYLIIYMYILYVNCIYCMYILYTVCILCIDCMYIVYVSIYIYNYIYILHCVYTCTVSIYIYSLFLSLCFSDWFPFMKIVLRSWKDSSPGS